MADGCLSWNGVIEKDGQDFVILPEGDYDFQCTKVQRGQFPGSTKLPPCDKAIVELKVVAEDGREAFARVDLILHTSLEWKLSEFFRSIGHKRHGERIMMDWERVPGAKGKAHFKPREYVTKSGGTGRTNSVEKFYDSAASLMPLGAGQTMMDDVIASDDTLPF